MNGALRIPISEINAYAQLHRYPLYMAMDLLTYISALDRAYLAYLKEKRAEEEGRRPKKAADGTPPPPPRGAPPPSTPRRDPLTPNGRPTQVPKQHSPRPPQPRR